MFSNKDCYLLSIGCIAILLIGCLSSKKGAIANDASDRSDVIATPSILTYILEEVKGLDSLSLKQVVKGQGYLKTELDYRVGPIPANQFRISLLSASGDTLAQILKASALNERLESSTEDGAVRSIEVEHPSAVHVIRSSNLQTDYLLIERSDSTAHIRSIQKIKIKG